MKLKDIEDTDWDKMLKVHLYGTFHCSREALKVMEAKGYGKIVSISSIAAAALYLACDDSNFVTGQIISPNGGW